MKIGKIYSLGKAEQIGHTVNCLMNAAAADFARFAFARQYPDRCTRCSGLGYLEYRDDPSPAGVGLSPGYMTFSDPCPNCFELGICPLCGKNAIPDEPELTSDEDFWVCGNCGWRSDRYLNGETDLPVMPERAECDCYMLIPWSE